MKFQLNIHLKELHSHFRTAPFTLYRVNNKESIIALRPSKYMNFLLQKLS